jgi:hypothetical protein
MNLPLSFGFSKTNHHLYISRISTDRRKKERQIQQYINQCTHKKVIFYLLLTYYLLAAETRFLCLASHPFCKSDAPPAPPAAALAG